MKKRVTFLTAFLLMLCCQLFAQGNSNIRGQIKDSKGNALPGVTIRVKGTNQGTTSQGDGSFSLTVPGTATLEVSYVGYASQEIAVNGRSTINITMTDGKTDLGEVVVIGYGTQKKQDVTSAIASVSTKDISSRPIVSAVEAITGKAPGVQVSVPSGQPGGDLSVRVRGIGSPNGGEPLYVVDGVLASDIKTIDPNTIESISVLKDASAAGIYGAAGSTNGVVMITTKQGTKGAMKVDANVYTGMQQIVKKLPVLNNSQWVDLMTDIHGTTPSLPSYYNLDSTNNNWQDIIYRKAMQTGANVGMSGGSDKGTFYFNVGYLNQDGIMVGSNFNRYSVKLSLDQKPKEWLRIGGNVSYNRSYQRSTPQNASTQNGGAVIAALVTPEYIPIKMPAGSPYPGVYGYSNFFSGDNPLSDIWQADNKTIANNLLGNVYTEITLPFNIKYRSQFNAIMENSRYDWFLDPYSSLYGISLTGAGRENTSEVFRYSWDNTLTYDKHFGKHALNVVVGSSALEEKISTGSQYGTGFASGSVTTLNGASTNYSISTGRYNWTTNSYFGRVMYSYADRYLLTATLRADGSSRVGTNNRWGTFPAVSLGWKVSQEKFMENVTFVQNLKIRAGYGATGNLPPYTMLYPTYSLLSAGSAYSYSSGAASPGVSPNSQIGNPNLKWESAKQANIGFDASFLQSRITFSADYYYKKVDDMIFTQQLPLTTGGATTAVNLPGHDINKGVELSASAVVVDKKDWGWDVSANISFNNNKITGMDSTTSYQTGGVSVGGSKQPIYTGLIKNGYSLGTFWGYKAMGVDPQTGNMVYSANMMDLGNALPKYTYGINSNFHYKNFSLDVLFDGVHGNKVYNETRMEIENLTGYTNESASVLRRWKQPGDVTDIPRAKDNGTTNATAAALLQSQIASNYVEDGSFFRLRSATLAYNFDASLLKHIGIAGLRVYATAQNLFTITNYKGYYPEINGFGTGTNNQATNAGSSASLMTLGVDNGTYPAAKTYTLGLNVQF
ncbi:TonB-dependent receptor [Chitinophaga sp.]|uniref:SusC/RagA family TonB-linked outer membrane protein n=1 Tax=Chitinophaga sp. TaxID=1869181 RepID=UPI0031DCCF18